MDAAELAENTISGGKCEQYAKDQLWMNFITSSASAVTVIVNVVIKFLMLVLVKYERPRLNKNIFHHHATFFVNRI